MYKRLIERFGLEELENLTLHDGANLEDTTEILESDVHVHGAKDRSPMKIMTNDFAVAAYNMQLTIHDGTPLPIAIEKDSNPFLYIGSIGSAYNKQSLLASGITHILCLSVRIKMLYPELFIYKRINIVDKPDFDLPSVILQCLDFIHLSHTLMPPNGKILVHCYQGKSRSVAVICAYMIKYFGYSYGEALSIVRQVRPNAQPNTGFERYLNNFE
eukprot:gene4762-6679_t